METRMADSRILSDLQCPSEFPLVAMTSEFSQGFRPLGDTSGANNPSCMAIPDADISAASPLGIMMHHHPHHHNPHYPHGFPGLGIDHMPTTPPGTPLSHQALAMDSVDMSMTPLSSSAPSFGSSGVMPHFPFHLHHSNAEYLCQQHYEAFQQQHIPPPSLQLDSRLPVLDQADWAAMSFPPGVDVALNYRFIPSTMAAVDPCNLTTMARYQNGNYNGYEEDDEGTEEHEEEEDEEEDIGEGATVNMKSSDETEEKEDEEDEEEQLEEVDETDMALIPRTTPCPSFFSAGMAPLAMSMAATRAGRRRPYSMVPYSSTVIGFPSPSPSSPGCAPSSSAPASPALSGSRSSGGGDNNNDDDDEYEDSEAVIDEDDDSTSSTTMLMTTTTTTTTMLTTKISAVPKAKSNNNNQNNHHNNHNKNNNTNTTTNPTISKRSKASYHCMVPGCPQTFSRPYNLRSHLMAHTVYREYECSQCEAAFVRAHDRDRHERGHAKEKAHSCVVCKNRFARQDAVTRHLRQNEHHNPCATILTRRNLSHRDAAAGRIQREALGPEDDVVAELKILKNDLPRVRSLKRQEAKNKHLMMMMATATTTTTTAPLDTFGKRGSDDAGMGC
ncbi:hypothetical protein DFQ27_003005 [Actinomortierella ambigua]|uniref:C2H2-type domain-containing protein n=1 Tax=Actinomortierella ambigua TaxID=1343610 RepID=A0A9P6Q831_9FUNG|nr:hypothetical protein DFQ27_003005 [Actinomortierella ambigua]